MAKAPPKQKPEENQDPIEEIIEEIETVIEPPKKSTPMVTRKFENKIDLSPITDKLEELSNDLKSVLKPKEEPIVPPKKDEVPPPPPKKDYRWFDEFDPSVEM